MLQRPASALFPYTTLFRSGGGVSVNAQNTANLEASALNAVTSGGTGVGVTLTFNTIGWALQNILFNTVDAIIGDPAISTAFGGEVPSGAKAYVADTAVNAS